MNLYFEVAADRSAGAREQQRGAFHTTYLGEDGDRDKAVLVAIIADGVEGHSGGQVASNLVVSTFHRTLRRRIGESTFSALLRECTEAANRDVGEAIAETPELKGMACTLVAVLLVGGRLHWSSVGDSRLFLVRDGTLRHVNADHSYGALLEAARADGVDANPEPDLDPDNLISAITGEAIEELDCPGQGMDLRAGDRIIVAGRRIREPGEETILTCSKASGQAREAVSALVHAIEASVGEQREGTTVVVVDVLERDVGKTQPEAGVAGVADVAEVTPGVTAGTATGARGASALFDVLAGLGALVIFLGAAAGTWYGLGELNAWRDSASTGAASVPVLASDVSTVPGGATSSDPGLSVGAMPPAAPAVSGAPSAGGGSLTFGAPAPLAIGGAPGVPASPQGPPEVDGFRDTLADGTQGPLMVTVPAGRFQMGSRSGGVHPAATPRREVRVRAFAVSSHEVTVEQYARFAGATGRTLPKVQVVDPATTPISGVSWDDAYAYTRWLSQQTGKRYYLPSEAEWEYAARAGTQTLFWWGNEVGQDRAHCDDCDTGLNTSQASRVGRFDPNPFGLHDTAGNLAEWVHDCWHPDYRDAPSDGRAWEGGGDCTNRVVRGGSFRSTSKSLHSAAREKVPADRAPGSIGFRVARKLDE